MVSAKQLRSLAPADGLPGTRRRKLRPVSKNSPILPLGGGISKLAFVHAPPNLNTGMWTIMFRRDGYSFRLGIRNRMLAGFVARLIHAAADPDSIEKGSMVNEMCENSAAETEYPACQASVFALTMPDIHGDNISDPNLIVVDSKVADRIRGFPWFHCQQRGIPASWAVRPVVRVDRGKRSISVSWITVESEILRGSRKSILKPRDFGYSGSDDRYVDLRLEFKGLRSSYRPAPPSGGLSVSKRGKSEGVIAPYHQTLKLPKEGISTLERTFRSDFRIRIKGDLGPLRN